MKASPPPRTDALRATRYILIAIALLGLAIITWRLSEVLALTFGGIVGAAMLRGLALPLARRSGLSVKWSLSLVTIALLGLVGVLFWLFGKQVADQAKEMEKLIPQAVQQLTDNLNQSAAGQAAVKKTKEALADSKAFSGVGLAAGSAVFAVADVLLVFFLSVYFAFDPHEYLDGCLRLLPLNQRRHVKQALVAAGEALRRWLLAQLIAMVIIGVLVGAVLSMMRIPLAFLLGALAGLLEFIPVVGAVLFTIPGVLIAFTQGPSAAFYVLLAYIGVQQLESNIIIPLLQRWAVRLPPALTLISVVVGGILLGVPGLVFASPLAVVVMTLVKQLYVEETLEHEKPARAASAV